MTPASFHVHHYVVMKPFAPVFVFKLGLVG